MLGFLDLEATDAQIPPEKGSILELAILLVDDEKLEAVASFTTPVRPLPGYEAMPSVVELMHEKSGLLADIEKTGVRRYEAELLAIDFLKKAVVPPKLALVGNSVWFDFVWLKYHMPKLADYFHRRLIDITSFNEVAQRFNFDLYKHRPTDEQPKHRALVDCQSSLNTLRYYRDNGLFRSACEREHVSPARTSHPGPF